MFAQSDSIENIKYFASVDTKSYSYFKKNEGSCYLNFECMNIRDDVAKAIGCQL